MNLKGGLHKLMACGGEQWHVDNNGILLCCLLEGLCAAKSEGLGLLKYTVLEDDGGAEQRVVSWRQVIRFRIVNQKQTRSKHTVEKPLVRGIGPFSVGCEWGEAARPRALGLLPGR